MHRHRNLAVPITLARARRPERTALVLYEGTPLTLVLRDYGVTTDLRGVGGGMRLFGAPPRPPPY